MTAVLEPPASVIAEEFHTYIEMAATSGVKGAMQGLHLGGELLVADIKHLLSQPHSGPIYGGNSPNPASLPGEPPAYQQGALHDSYFWLPAGPDGIAVGSSSEYAAYLEFGTSTIKPRPHFRVAIQASILNVHELIRSQAARMQTIELGRLGGAQGGP